MTLVKCKPGTIANQQQSCPDQDAVGIQSITQSADKTKLYITLTDGTTQTFTLPVGQGQQGIPGTNGQNGANGSNLIWSDPADHPTTTQGAYETLSSFSTNKLNAGQNLVNVGDQINLFAWLTATKDTPIAPTISAQIIINGTGLSNIVIDSGQLPQASNQILQLFCKLILTENTVGAMKCRIIWGYAFGVETIFGLNSFTGNGAGIIGAKSTIIGGATVDFSANDYTISLQAQSVTIGDVKSQYFSAEKLAYGTGVSPTISVGGQYENDALAAAGGIAIGSFYINTDTGALTQRLT